MERLLLQKTLSDILGCPDRGEKVPCVLSASRQQGNDL